MGEVKQTNFRIDQDTADAFRQFCEDNGMNQAQGFDHVMQIVELDRAKAVTPGRATEIEGFEKSVKDIMGAYLRSIEINNNAEERIREQFGSSLERKDKTIDELREKVECLQEELKTAEEEKDAAQKAQATAEEREKNATEQMDAAKRAVADQERINSMLSAQLADATEKLNGFDALKISETALKAEVTELKHKVKDSENTLEHTKEIYEARLINAKETADRCKALEKIESELKDKLVNMELTIGNQKKDAENAVNAVRAQAELNLERAVMAKEKEMNEQLREADKENARLTAQIEQLQTKIEQLEK